MSEIEVLQQEVSYLIQLLADTDLSDIETLVNVTARLKEVICSYEKEKEEEEARMSIFEHFTNFFANPVKEGKAE